jgi:hypothetical protein
LSWPASGGLNADAVEAAWKKALDRSEPVRFGYRRLTVMLRREGRAVNAKRIYRLY